MDPISSTGLAREPRRTVRRGPDPAVSSAPSTQSLSVVIPVRNDAARLKNTLSRLSSWIERTGRVADVVVVAQGGSRSVADVILAFSACFRRLRVLENAGGTGRGAAIRIGLAAAQEPVTIVCGADLATPFEDAEALLGAIESGADLAVGSSRVRGATILRTAPLKRRAFDALLAFVAGDLVPSRVADGNPGMIVLHANRIRTLLPACRVDGDAWAVELYAVMRRAGLAIKELPVRYTADRRARFAFWSSTFEMMRELTRLAARLRAADGASRTGAP